MRRQDFIQDRLDKVKFTVSFPGEVVTTQESIDDFAIEFCIWLSNNQINLDTDYKKDHFKTLLKQYKNKL